MVLGVVNLACRVRGLGSTLGRGKLRFRRAVSLGAVLVERLSFMVLVLKEMV